MGNGENGSTSWKAGLEFAGHIVMATLVFMLIALAAVGLKEFTEWLPTVFRFPGWMHTVLTALEYGLFAIDVATFAVYVVVTTVKFIKAIL